MNFDEAITELRLGHSTTRFCWPTGRELKLEIDPSGMRWISRQGGLWLPGFMDKHGTDWMIFNDP